MKGFSEFFLPRCKDVWTPYWKASTLMRSKHKIQEGMVQYCDLDFEPTPNYIILCKDHLVRIEDVELYKRDPNKALSQSFVMPMSTAKIILYEFDQKQLEHTIMVKFQGVLC